MFRVLVYDEAQYIRSKVIRILKTFKIDVIEAGSQAQLNYLSNENGSRFDLILADVNFDSDGVSKWLENYMANHPFTPLIIYTSSVTRATLVSGLKLGAKDYILKSSDDDVFVERVMKNLQAGESAKTEEVYLNQIVFDLNTYLSGELRKAQKGRYELSIGLSVIQPIGENITDKDLNYEEGSRIINRIRQHYWDTDLLIQYGPRGFVSFFPFCGINETEIVDGKLKMLFATMQENNANLKGFALMNTFVTYPKDGIDQQSILDKMGRLLKQ
ncbi:response regulator [Fusibacter paucivorans]|uniref:Stage 0 sporulation protein A homolog n=1 Tax=Fusibacter paucivorans TaxID=76009 RepID=A0ABS5PMS1_9FIRM|nr:response regulator [Fusibacter paucivorans]